MSISPVASDRADNVALHKEDMLWSTRADEGGSGQPMAFALEKGTRPPRAWEVALKGVRVCV